MKLAKADENDLHAALAITGVLDDIAKGEYPRDVQIGDKGIQGSGEGWFDEDDPAHLRALYDRLKFCMDAAPGGLFRVTFGMATVLDPKNAIVDPDADHLALHPRFEERSQQIEMDSADAGRYRYLRKHHLREWVSDMPHDKGAPSLDLDFSAEGHDLDAAIDRAMSKTPKTGATEG